MKEAHGHANGIGLVRDRSASCQEELVFKVAEGNETVAASRTEIVDPAR